LLRRFLVALAAVAVLAGCGSATPSQHTVPPTGPAGSGVAPMPIVPALGQTPGPGVTVPPGAHALSGLSVEAAQSALEMEGLACLSSGGGVVGAPVGFSLYCAGDLVAHGARADAQVVYFTPERVAAIVIHIRPIRGKSTTDPVATAGLVGAIASLGYDDDNPGVARAWVVEHLADQACARVACETTIGRARFTLGSGTPSGELTLTMAAA
jgi:hypothetical protein